MANTGPFSKKWEDLEFSDNFIFCKVMQNENLCKQMLEILLGIEIHHVKHIRQENSYEDIMLRARYYQGAMDLATTKRRTKYAQLKESYIIFICKEDPFNQRLPVYTRQNSFKETNAIKYQDKSNIVFYNASGYSKAESKNVRSVLQFIYNLKSDSDFTDELAESVNQAKAQPEFVEEYMYFSDILEDEKEKAELKGVEKGRTEGLKKGQSEKQEEIVLKMLKAHMPEKNIREFTGISEEELKELMKHA